jgi:hypothetical protein
MSATIAAQEGVTIKELACKHLTRCLQANSLIAMIFWVVMVMVLSVRKPTDLRILAEMTLGGAGCAIAVDAMSDVAQFQTKFEFL